MCESGEWKELYVVGYESDEARYLWLVMPLVPFVLVMMYPWERWSLFLCFVFASCVQEECIGNDVWGGE